MGGLKFKTFLSLVAILPLPISKCSKNRGCTFLKSGNKKRSGQLREPRCRFKPPKSGQPEGSMGMLPFQPPLRARSHTSSRSILGRLKRSGMLNKMSSCPKSNCKSKGKLGMPPASVSGPISQPIFAKFKGGSEN